ncbi:hypothetical protein [Pararhizobium sp. PWRC1-1]|uniref:hypothetical protein n=1 Tax=Pararhizobium sp. PWRC1-1 TaxID=2804566 RepID=UPI003CEEF0ED
MRNCKLTISALIGLDRMKADGEKLTDLADPLTAVALHVEAALRFLDRENKDLSFVREQLGLALERVRISHLIFSSLEQQR